MWLEYTDIEVNPVIKYSMRGLQKQIQNQVLQILCDKPASQLLQMDFVWHLLGADTGIIYKNNDNSSGLYLINKLQWQRTHRDNMIILVDTFLLKHFFYSNASGSIKFLSKKDWLNEYHFSGLSSNTAWVIRVHSLLSCALYHGVLLTGVLKTGRRPGDGPAVWARHRGLDVLLQEVEQRVPPGVSEVVVGWAFQSL